MSAEAVGRLSTFMLNKLNLLTLEEHDAFIFSLLARFHLECSVKSSVEGFYIIRRQGSGADFYHRALLVDASLFPL
ncbi:hypothetical protein ACAX46_004450 [Providencia rettgeri]